MDERILVWIILGIGILIRMAKAQKAAAQERQRTETAFDRLDEALEGEEPQQRPKPLFGGPVFTEFEGGELAPTVRTPQTPEALKRQIESRKQELKRKRKASARSVSTTTEAAAGSQGAPLTETSAAELAAAQSAPETAESGFDLRKAVIYAEILKPRYEAYD